MSKTYRINEIFYSIQGEGIRAGTANVFVRFSACNLRCSVDDPDSGFDCDTEFTSGQSYELGDLVSEIAKAGTITTEDMYVCPNVILTGGEPGLQIDDELIAALKHFNKYVAVETNGTIKLPNGINWVCCSPKSAEHTLRISRADELKYVRHEGQGIPKPSVPASNYLLSPRFNPDGTIDRRSLAHCIDLVKQNPKWRLSVQQHKFWEVR